jgi:hypothetical protein
MQTKKKKLALTRQDVSAVLKHLDDNLSQLKKRWDGQNQGIPSWWGLNKDRLVRGTKFIIESLDKMILLTEDLIPEGSDKRTAVLFVTTKLFDYTVARALPIWLWPFVPIIRSIIINVIVANTVDFIVNKYNQGIWKKDVNNAQTKFRIKR